ncbi:Protein argonaute MEL1 [Hordeum vulgare]|nr:Protein argonaute MEL1 [Hordeum vulgare]
MPPTPDLLPSGGTPSPYKTRPPPAPPRPVPLAAALPKPRRPCPSSPELSSSRSFPGALLLPRPPSCLPTATNRRRRNPAVSPTPQASPETSGAPPRPPSASASSEIFAGAPATKDYVLFLLVTSRYAANKSMDGYAFCNADGDFLIVPQQGNAQKRYSLEVSINPESKSRAVNREVLSELIKVHGKTSLGGKLPAYDGRKSLYTAGPLPFESEEFSVTLVDSEKKDKERAEREYKITIRIAGRTDLYHLQQFLKGRQRDMPQETIQVLDVAGLCPNAPSQSSPSILSTAIPTAHQPAAIVVRKLCCNLGDDENDGVLRPKHVRCVGQICPGDIVMDKPGGEGAPKHQMIECYIHTLAKVLGSCEGCTVSWTGSVGASLVTSSPVPAPPKVKYKVKCEAMKRINKEYHMYCNSRQY